MQPTVLVLWPLGSIRQTISVRCAAAKFKGMGVYFMVGSIGIGVKSQVRSADYHTYFFLFWRDKIILFLNAVKR